MRINIVTVLLIIVIVIILLKIYLESDYYNLKCIISDINGKRYCVRERNKINEAADLLAEATNNMELLVKTVSNKYPDRANIIRLKNNFNPKKIQETLPNSVHTAYSENKGEKLAFCLTKNENGKSSLIDINTLMFVAIHELAHLATESIGHQPEFWKNFKFLLEEATKINIYNAVDYKKNPESYCGMNITDNPLFDIV